MSADGLRIPICVFAKPPIAGEAKSRLAQGLGATAAALLARAFFEDTWATVRGLPWARPILATTMLDTSSFGIPEDAEVWLQGPGDLGERMERILARAVAEAGRALLIGADVPGLPHRHLELACEALVHHEAVLGPAEDGGFYLLGMTRIPAGILAGLPWNSPDALVHTERRLLGAGLTVARAPSWFDVDVPGDLDKLRSRLDRVPGCAPRTRAALSSLAHGEA